MKPLSIEFVKNDITYKILERTETRYFAALYRVEDNAPVGYETGRIVQHKAHTSILRGEKVNFEAKEIIIPNEQFGHDKFEKCMRSLKNKNLVYVAYHDGQNFDLRMAKSTPWKPELHKVI